MAEDQRFIITHKDGRTYSVTRHAFDSIYAEQGFKVDHPEADGDFMVTGVPKPKRKRTPPRAKAAAPVVEPESLPDESAPAGPTTG